MTLALAVGLAAGVGAVLRHLVAVALGAGPRATLAVNVAGSLFAGAALGADLSDDATLVATAGLAGGLTTLSTWAVEVLALARDGRRAAAATYAIGTLLLCVAAVAVGRGLTG